MQVLRQYARFSWAPNLGSETSSARLERTVFGLRFPNPVGLAAGFDKNAVAVPAWAKLGFGFVEVGTITAQGQPGNPKPRIFRVPENEALINRLGFNNDGVEAISIRLEQARRAGNWPQFPLGVNLGKSRVIPLEVAATDYLQSFRRTVGVGDYFVLNVSSPNTPGLRKLQERNSIDALFRTIQEVNPGKPLLVKVAPDLSEDEIEDLLELTEAHGLAGIVATNTTIDHSSIAMTRREQGGLSGKPLGARSLQVLRFLKQRTKLPIISVGGIMNADNASERFDSGAALIQLYTGFVYRGPELIREILKRIEGEG